MNSAFSNGRLPSGSPASESESPLNRRAELKDIGINFSAVTFSRCVGDWKVASLSVLCGFSFQAELFSLGRIRSHECNNRIKRIHTNVWRSGIDHPRLGPSPSAVKGEY